MAACSCVLKLFLLTPQEGPQGAGAGLPGGREAVSGRLARGLRRPLETVPRRPRRAAGFLPLRVRRAGAQAAAQRLLPAEEAGVYW